MVIVLEDSAAIPYFTDLRSYFKAFDGTQIELNWLITDYECNWYPPEFPRGDFLWLSGNELTERLNTTEIQFIWGVFSGISKNASYTSMKSPFPFCVGNERIWNASAKPQHPNAVVEIVSWDSSATLLISEDARIIEKVRTFFPTSHLL